jgi:hypothetical protein
MIMKIAKQLLKLNRVVGKFFAPDDNVSDPKIRFRCKVVHDRNSLTDILCFLQLHLCGVGNVCQLGRTKGQSIF